MKRDATVSKRGQKKWRFGEAVSLLEGEDVGVEPVAEDIIEMRLRRGSPSRGGADAGIYTGKTKTKEEKRVGLQRGVVKEAFFLVCVCVCVGRANLMRGINGPGIPCYVVNTRSWRPFDFL